MKFDADELVHHLRFHGFFIYFFRSCNSPISGTILIEFDLYVSAADVPVSKFYPKNCKIRGNRGIFSLFPSKHLNLFEGVNASNLSQEWGAGSF